MPNNVLGPEVGVIQAIYSRNEIFFERFGFQPTRGVAEGSIISPVLFNINLDMLLNKLNTIGVDTEDILACADDILILASNKNELLEIMEQLPILSNK